jgi:hypothetical protein
MKSGHCGEQQIVDLSPLYGAIKRFRMEEQWGTTLAPLPKSKVQAHVESKKKQAIDRYIYLTRSADNDGFMRY